MASSFNDLIILIIVILLRQKLIDRSFNIYVDRILYAERGQK